MEEVYLHWSDLVNCTHVALHAGLNKPSALFTATIQQRAGVHTVLFISYTLFVSITQEKR